VSGVTTARRKSDIDPLVAALANSPAIRQAWEDVVADSDAHSKDPVPPPPPSTMQPGRVDQAPQERPTEANPNTPARPRPRILPGITKYPGGRRRR
jgi:hypothetical protein